MYVTIPKRELATLVARVAGVADPKSSMPILSMTLLRADAGRLRASATDLFLAVESSSPADMGHAGACAVNGKELVERVKAMPEGGIRLSMVETSLVIASTTAKRQFRIRFMPADDFPKLPSVPADPKVRFSIVAAELRGLTRRVAHSISADQTRPHLNSMRFRTTPKLLELCTTDGHRLTRAVRAFGGPTVEWLLTQGGVTELQSICDVAGDVEIAFHPPNVFATIGDTTLAMKVVDAAFPPIESVIPDNQPGCARVVRKVLIESLRAIALAGGSVKLAIGKGVLRISGENPDSGSALDEIPIEHTGPEVLLGFNAKFLIEALEVLDVEEVEIGHAGELDPLLIHGIGDAPESIGIVMPMRI